MNGTELDLMRLLHGELPEAQARALRERLDRDPALAEEYRKLHRTWEGLVLPPPSPVPPGFSQRVMARARADAWTRRPAEGLSLRGAPVWVRAAAAVALVAGTALGIGVGGRLPVADETQTTTAQTVQTEETQSDDLTADLEDSLAGSYWETVEDLQ
jgi:anti-sigma factor RsiW